MEGIKPAGWVCRPEYPRPQLERAEWLNLNGSWDFRFEQEAWQTIKVPFAFQSRLSGVDTNRACDRVAYRRRFELPAQWRGKKLLLHFGAVDYACQVWINGCHVGGNIGFSLDITSALSWEEEEIYLEVVDPSREETIPRGKQYWLPEPDAIWYKRTTGIWQTVWLEPVDACRVERFRFTGDVDQGRVTVDYACSPSAVGGSWSWPSP